MSFWHWLARRLPRRVIYWCAVDVWTHGTVGEFSNQEVPSLTCIEALNRYAKSHGM